MTNEQFTQTIQQLTDEIKAAYESSVTIEEAEKLAGKFLHAQLLVAEKLHQADLDARMRKSGVKALKAAVYLEAATKTEKKPSDVMLMALVDSDKLVLDEQGSFDKAEVDKNALENYLSVFREAHIFFRGVAKGRFE